MRFKIVAQTVPRSARDTDMAILKKCVICGRAFQPSKRYQQRLTCSHKCKNTQYRNDNREQINKRELERREANREQYNERVRERRAGNRERYNERDRERRAANREQYNENQRKYREANRERINKNGRKYRAANREQFNRYLRERYRIERLAYLLLSRHPGILTTTTQQEKDQ
jgi:hypothetical protein